MSPTVEPMVSGRGLTRWYGERVCALDGVDLDVTRGEFLAIVGASGSGKSTLLNLIGTLDRPTAGSLRIAGALVGDLSDAQLSRLRAVTIGFVFQQFHLSKSLSAAENVAQGLLYQGLRRSDRQSRAADALERVGLGGRLAHRPHELSGGEQQRVALARAVVSRPRLLLADEPTGSLDTAAGAVIMALLTDLNAEGTTIVLITHDHQVADMAQRRVVISDGRIEHTAVRVPA